MDHFASFDTDDDGVVDFEEFKSLYVHLGGTAEAVEVDSAQDEARRAHPMWELFSKYDLNGDSVLSQYEVGEMMQDMGYKTEADYVQQTMDAFGEYDGNGDSVIELDEFASLWQHLGGAMPAGALPEQNEAPAHEAATPQQTQEAPQSSAALSPAEEKLAATFKKYDTKGDEVLDTAEVTAMMEDMGYKTTPDYVEGIMEVFADFDDHDDANPVVQFERFGELWSHLGGGEHSGAAAAAEGPQDTPYRAEFDKYDLNGDGLLSQHEVKQMMVTLGYKANSDYVTQLLDTFGSYDVDDDGVIEPAEFKMLWEHLGMHTKGVAEGLFKPAEEAPAEEEAAHPLQETFDGFDLNKDGALDETEVKAMMGRLGYKTSDDYVLQTMELFGEWDTSGDHLIQLDEFEALWNHLGGEQVLASKPAAGSAFSVVRGAATSDPLYQRFTSFDQAGNGTLTRHDIQKMMTALGYAANDDYLTELLDLFGSFDKDDDGQVDFEEWKELWAHLGGEDAMGVVDPDKKAAANAHDESDPLWATFKKYDRTNSNSLSSYEVKEMMVRLGYKADDQYAATHSYFSHKECTRGLRLCRASALCHLHAVVCAI